LARATPVLQHSSNIFCDNFDQFTAIPSAAGVLTATIERNLFKIIRKGQNRSFASNYGV
jgi:hypothetical protein